MHQEGDQSGRPSPIAGQATSPKRRRRRKRRQPERSDAVYGALDLGTNNCRLLVARRTKSGFQVIDAFSRIVRLGEGLAGSGDLSEAAMDRAIEALRVCAEKMNRRGVTRARAIATQACRMAGNGSAFLQRVKAETGLELDIVSTEDEARLAVAGCAPLLDPDCASALVFDIGGGSTELMWVRREGARRPRILSWTSLACGVVTLAERYGGQSVAPDTFERMVSDVSDGLAAFVEHSRETHQETGNDFHLLGTSGTVTTIAGVHLGLKKYNRNHVDGIWITPDEARTVTEALLGMDFNERASHPCVGRERADLVLAGCAILEAINRAWPSDRLRVADRGLREGILMSLMNADETAGRRRRKRRRSRGRSQAKDARPGISEQAAP